MSTDTPEVKEKEVGGWPGWTKIQMGNSKRFVSPGGVEISAARFLRLATEHRGQKYIPESEILEDLKAHDPNYRNSPRGFMGAPFQTKQSTKPKVENPGVENPKPKEPKSMEYTDLIEPEPRARSHTGSKKHPRPSQVTLAIGFKKLALLLTAVVIARLLNDDRAALSEEEATALGIALGNLLVDSDWNEKYGWLVAETGDWQMVGYVLIKYLFRLSEVLKDKNDERKRQHSGNAYGQPASGNAAGNGTGSPGQFQFVPNRTASPIGVTQPARTG